MPVENFVRLRLPGRPNGDMRIGAGRYNASILEISDRIHRAFVEAKNLLGSIAGQRPADRGCIETARDRVRSVRRNCQRLHRPAVTAQLSLRSTEGERTQKHAKTD